MGGCGEAARSSHEQATSTSTSPKAEPKARPPSDVEPEVRPPLVGYEAVALMMPEKRLIMLAGPSLSAAGTVPMKAMSDRMSSLA